MSTATRAPTRKEVRQLAARVLLVVALVGAAIAISRLASVVLVAFAALLGAIALRAAAEPLARVTHLSPRWAVVIVAFVAAASIAGGLWLFGAALQTELREAGVQLGRGYELIHEVLKGTVLESWTGEFSRQLAKAVEAAVGRAGTLAAGAVGLITDAILVVFIAIYLALEPEVYVKGVLALIPESHRDLYRRAFARTGSDLRKWLVGQALTMIVVGAMTTLGLWIAGVPMPFALGLLAGVLDFVPLLGPVVAALPGLLLALGESHTTALYALAVYVIVQQLEGNVALPYLQRWSVSLPPAVTLLAIVTGGLIFGVAGILVATPAAVAIIALVNVLYIESGFRDDATAS